MSLPNAPSDLSSTQIQLEELEMIINNLVDRLISEIQSVVVWVGKGAHCDKLISCYNCKLEISNITRLLHHHRPTTPRAKFESYVKYTQLEERIYFVLFCSLLPSCYDS